PPQRLVYGRRPDEEAEDDEEGGFALAAYVPRASRPLERDLGGQLGLLAVGAAKVEHEEDARGSGERSVRAEQLELADRRLGRGDSRGDVEGGRVTLRGDDGAGDLRGEFDDPRPALDRGDLGLRELAVGVREPALLQQCRPEKHLNVRPS